MARGRGLDFGSLPPEIVIKNTFFDISEPRDLEVAAPRCRSLSPAWKLADSSSTIGSCSTLAGSLATGQSGPDSSVSLASVSSAATLPAGPEVEHISGNDASAASPYWCREASSLGRSGRIWDVAVVDHESEDWPGTPSSILPGWQEASSASCAGFVPVSPSLSNLLPASSLAPSPQTAVPEATKQLRAEVHSFLPVSSLLTSGSLSPTSMDFKRKPTSSTEVLGINALDLCLAASRSSSRSNRSSRTAQPASANGLLHENRTKKSDVPMVKCNAGAVDAAPQPSGSERLPSAKGSRGDCTSYRYTYGAGCKDDDAALASTSPMSAGSQRMRLNPQSTLFVPGALRRTPSTPLGDIAKVVEAAEAALWASAGLHDVELRRSAMNTTLSARVGGSGPESAQFAIAAVGRAKHALLVGALSSQRVYVLGYDVAPFIDTLSGFKAILAYVPQGREGSVCWDIYSKGFCENAHGCCLYHPQHTDIMRLEVTIAAAVANINGAG